jgi:import receptor subunit TOM70
LGLQAKTAGNALYSQKQFPEAIVKYSEAINLAPNAIYYCNRAACFSNLKYYQKAIEYCNEAIKLDAKYIKAYHRRALAYEALENYEAALNEYTAVCALEGFRNQASMAAPDRLLKIISAKRTKIIMQDKVYSMPSETFISAYMDSFRSSPSDATIVASSASASESDLLLKGTFALATARKWQESYDATEAAIKSDSFSSEALKAIALNYRGTLRFLMGRVDDAVADLEGSLVLNSASVNTMIKRATLFMERGEIEKTIEQFAKGEKANPTNPDLFYHRGQVRFLTGDFQGAVEDYSVSLKNEKPEESSVYVHIQMGVALYKQGDIAGAEKKFRECKVKFPKSAEVWNYHGEILMDKQSYGEGIDIFDLALCSREEF